MNPLPWNIIRPWVARFCRDERGQTITEYAIFMGMFTLVCIWLIDPNNGLYGAMRNIYDRMVFMLYWPGP